jgi:hypothetical protein
MVKRIKKKDVEEIEAEMDRDLGLEAPKEEETEKELRYIG